MPSIGDLTGVIAPNETITFTKTDLGAITSTTLGGEALTIDSDIANVVTCTIPADIPLLWGSTGLDLVASDGTDSASITGLTLLTRSGWSFVNFNGVIPDELTTESFYELVVNDLSLTPVLGDQLQISDSTGLTVNGSWIPTVDPAADITGSWAFFDQSTGLRSAEQDYDIYQPLINNLTGTIAPNEVITFEVPEIFDPITSVTLGGEPLTIDGETDSVVTCTIPDGIVVPWGTTGLDLIANDGTGSVVETGLTLLARSGWIYATFNGVPPDELTTESFYELAINDRGFTAVAGDQVRTTAETGLTVDAQWLPTVDPENDVYGLYEILDESEGVILPPLDFSITRPDTTPFPFNFTDQDDVALNTVVTSDIITIEGLINPVLITVSGSGEYSLNGGAYTTSAGTADTGDTLRLRVTSSPSFFATTTTTLEVGGWSTDWTVTTLRDLLPNPITFLPVTNADTNTLYVSNTETVTGISDSVDISITGGDYSINGDPYTSIPSTINLNDTVTVRQLSSPSFVTQTITELTVGDLVTQYSVTTRSNIVPDPALVFDTVTGASVNTAITSNAQTVLSITDPSPVSVVGGEYNINGGAYTSDSGTVVDGDIVTVRVTSSINNAATTVATLTVGGVDSTFTVVTEGLGANIIYFLLGLTEDDIPPEVIEYFITQWEIIYGDNTCMVLYNTIKSTYRWLIQKNNAGATNGKRREKRGRREIEVENSNNAKNFDMALNAFLRSPWDLLPQCRADFIDNGAGDSRLIVGGVKRDEVESVRQDCNSYGQYQEKSPFSPRPLRKNIFRGYKRGKGGFIR